MHALLVCSLTIYRNARLDIPFPSSVWKESPTQRDTHCRRAQQSWTWCLHDLLGISWYLPFAPQVFLMFPNWLTFYTVWKPIFIATQISRLLL